MLINTRSLRGIIRDPLQSRVERGKPPISYLLRHCGCPVLMNNLRHFGFPNPHRRFPRLLFVLNTQKVIKSNIKRLQIKESSLETKPMYGLRRVRKQIYDDQRAPLIGKNESTRRRSGTSKAKIRFTVSVENIL